MEQRKKLTQIGNIRALAIFLVVLGHSIILYSPDWNLFETDRRVLFLEVTKKVIDIPQMPLFFSLSGYLFVLTHRKQQGFFQLLKNKALRLLVPYLGVGLCFMLPIRVSIGFTSYQNLGVAEIVRKFWNSSDVGHLWFLPALFLIFLLSELILTIGERLPGIRKYPELFLAVVSLGLYLEGYRISLGYGPLQGAYNYLLWFSVGYVVHIHQRLVRKIYGVPAVKWVLILLNVVLAAYCLLADSVRVLVSLGVRGLYLLNAYGSVPEKTCYVAETIDRNSFGIYLFHSPLIYITFAYIPNAHPALVIFLNLVVFGAGAYYLTALIRRTKLRVLIGE